MPIDLEKKLAAPSPWRFEARTSVHTIVLDGRALIRDCEADTARERDPLAAVSAREEEP